MMERSRSKGDYIRTLERRISDLQNQVDVLYNRDQSIDWITVGSGGGAPAFASGWNHYNVVYPAQPWAPISFGKDSAGNVHLRGLAVGPSSAAANIIFTLPVGYRPGLNMWLIFVVDGSGGFSRLDIHADGVVVPSSGVADGYYSLAGVIFRPA